MGDLLEYFDKNGKTIYSKLEIWDLSRWHRFTSLLKKKILKNLIKKNDQKKTEKNTKWKDETLGTSLEEGYFFSARFIHQKFTHHPEMEVLWMVFSVSKIYSDWLKKGVAA